MYIYIYSRRSYYDEIFYTEIRKCLNFLKYELKSRFTIEGLRTWCVKSEWIPRESRNRIGIQKPAPQPQTENFYMICNCTEMRIASCDSAKLKINDTSLCQDNRSSGMRSNGKLRFFVIFRVYCVI